MGEYVVIVTGSRSRKTGADRAIVWGALDAVLAQHEPLTVRHGACPVGPDNYAQAWAIQRRAEGRFVTPDPRPADWKRHGRAKAGFVRNGEMIDDGGDEVLAFPARCLKSQCARKPPHPTHGTGDCMKSGRKAGIPVNEVTRWT